MSHCDILLMNIITLRYPFDEYYHMAIVLWRVLSHCNMLLITIIILWYYFMNITAMRYRFEEYCHTAISFCWILSHEDILLWSLAALFDNRIRLHIKSRLGEGRMSLQRRPKRMRIRNRDWRLSVSRTDDLTCGRRHVRQHQWYTAPEVRCHGRHRLLRWVSGFYSTYLVRSVVRLIISERKSAWIWSCEWIN